MTNQIIQLTRLSLLISCIILSGCLFLHSGKGPTAADALVGEAWKANKTKDFQLAIARAKKCIKYNEVEAMEMQEGMTKPVPTSRENLNKEAIIEKWALNYVGTSYFIMGRAYAELGKKEEALQAYQHLVVNFPFAHCWDPKGYFWKPAVAAKKRIKELESKPNN
jgi:tetratricopeptide (TPR) repeat protein